MIQGNENQSAWYQYYAAAVIAVSAKASEGKGSPLDGLQNTSLAIANRAAQLADQMMAERQKRFK